MTVLPVDEGLAHRGRPRSEDLDAAIVEAALEVFSEVGYYGLTFEAVAQRAGCKRPAIYRRFANRRDLMLHVIGVLIRNAEAPPQTGVSSRQRLVNHLSAYVGFLKGRGGRMAIALALARDSDPALGAACDGMFERETAEWEDIIQAAVGGGVPADRVRLFIDTALGTVNFRVAMRKDDMSEAEVEQLVDMLIQTARSTAA